MAVGQNALLLVEVPVSECKFNTKLMVVAMSDGKQI